MKEINCLICGKKKPPSKAHTQLCGNSQCGKELSLRKREEAKKWEITPEVKAHFSTFYSLMKKRTQGKARPCLKCRRMVLQNRFKVIKSYGGSTPTHKQCPSCKEWIPRFMMACICGEKDDCLLALPISIIS